MLLHCRALSLMRRAQGMAGFERADRFVIFDEKRYRAQPQLFPERLRPEPSWAVEVCPQGGQRWRDARKNGQLVCETVLHSEKEKSLESTKANSCSCCTRCCLVCYCGLQKEGDSACPNCTPCGRACGSHCADHRDAYGCLSRRPGRAQLAHHRRDQRLH